MNSAIPVPPTADNPVPPLTPGQLWRAWFWIGLQSFGGGNATFALIRQAFVEKKGWVEAEEFNRLFALVQLAPGINLLALTILIGRKLLGWRGVLVSIFGLLLPSVTVTTLLTAGYAKVQHTAVAQHAMHGFVPAVVGLGCVTSFQMAYTALKATKKEGRLNLAMALVVLVLSGFLVGGWEWPLLPVIFLAGSLQASATLWGGRKPPVEEAKP